MFKFPLKIKIKIFQPISAARLACPLQLHAWVIQFCFLPEMLRFSLRRLRSSARYYLLSYVFREARVAHGASQLPHYQRTPTAAKRAVRCCRPPTVPGPQHSSAPVHVSAAGRARRRTLLVLREARGSSAGGSSPANPPRVCSHTPGSSPLRLPYLESSRCSKRSATLAAGEVTVTIRVLT